MFASSMLLQKLLKGTINKNEKASQWTRYKCIWSVKCEFTAMSHLEMEQHCNNFASPLTKEGFDAKNTDDLNEKWLKIY